MKVLLIVPEIRLDNVPYFWPFWAGIFASIVEQKNQQVHDIDHRTDHKYEKHAGVNPSCWHDT